MDRSPATELLEFFKALSDASRLKIVGLLARSPLSVEQIAEMLGQSASTTSRHLSILAQAGLVSARAEGYYSVYSLETKKLEEMARRLLAREMLPAMAAGADLDAYDRKVLETFLTPGGRLREFPAQKKKLEVVLRHVANIFDPGVRYPEKQVNEMLKGFHEDTAQMRRSLVEFHLMEREGGGGMYWRTPDPARTSPAEKGG